MLKLMLEPPPWLGNISIEGWNFVNRAVNDEITLHSHVVVLAWLVL